MLKHRSLPERGSTPVPPADVALSSQTSFNPTLILLVAATLQIAAA